MARHDVVVPKMGMSSSDVDVIEWTVAVGERVEVGSALVDVESEKAVATIEAPVAGTVVAILAAPGETVDVGAPVCQIDTDG